MNLSAPFLCQFFKEQMHRILPYCDFIFGNETEAAAFAENNGISVKDIPSIAKAIAALPKINQKRKRKVVITQVCNLKIILMICVKYLLSWKWIKNRHFYKKTFFESLMLG